MMEYNLLRLETTNKIMQHHTPVLHNFPNNFLTPGISQGTSQIHLFQCDMLNVTICCRI